MSISAAAALLTSALLPAASITSPLAPPVPSAQRVYAQVERAVARLSDWIPINEPYPAEDPPVPGVVQPRLAVLIYHEVDDRYNNAYTVTPAQLESHVQMLLDEGYSFYTLADVERLLAGGEGMPAKGVLLTFDDGYSTFYTEVLPIAQKYSVPVTCFVVTKYVDEIAVDIRPHLSSTQMRALAESPLVDLASHSHNGHRTDATASGEAKPVLVNRIWDPQTRELETRDQYQARVLADFQKSGAVLKEHGVETGLRHFSFPFTTGSWEAVHLGEKAGFQYFYVGGEKLVTPETNPASIPRVNAGAPEITAEVLRSRLANLFAQP